MNKDVIYIAPEDDITDIIAKLKGASQKIVAIVPPQPLGVLRSAVNIKLIAKTADEASKVPVFVTSDPALLKLAAASQIPVTENLQTAPSIPTEEDLESRASTPEKEAKIAEDFAKPPRSVEKVINSTEVEKEIKKDSTSDLDDAVDAIAAEDKQSETPAPKTKNPLLQKIYDKFPWVAKNRKILLAAAIVFILLIGFCIWAFVFAPAATITVNIRASGNNFSENATFVTDEAKADPSAGKFFLQTEKIENESKVDFSATGKKDIGDKATGSVTIAIYFGSEGAVNIPSNTTFTYGGLNYLATSDTTIKWVQGSDSCENKNDSSSLVMNGCKVSGTVKVTASEPGSNYNLDLGKKDWTISTPIRAEFIKSASVENTEAISGGTSKVVTIVQQSDVDAARAKFSEANESDFRGQLFDKIPNNVLVLDETYKADVGDPVVSPKVGEEVPEGTTPKISSKAVYSVYTLNLDRVKEFIRTKATIGGDQEIYTLGNPFIEHLNSSGDTYTGKLKTTYKTGPKITQEEVLSKVSGRKVGEVQSLLKSINGVDSVSVTTSFFWVSKVPTDPNKITIDLKVDGENYQDLKNKSQNDGNQDSTHNGDSSDDSEHNNSQSEEGQKQ